jgi:HK97 gp10 family phage protein
MGESNAGFHRAIRNIPKVMRPKAARAVEAQARRLAAEMQKAASAHSKSGKTVASIRAERGSSDTQWIVKAGGPLTTKEVRAGSGVSYDYVRAVEFGTSDTDAIPFFWSTYRRLKGSMRKEINDGMRLSRKNGVGDELAATEFI